MADKEYSSAQCEYYDICGREVEGNPADRLCILHSTDSSKDAHAFAKALATHREHNGDKFVGFIFPAAGANFREATFSVGADFSSTIFSAGADFSGARFSAAGANFSGARFSGWTSFFAASFSERADFSSTTFSGGVNFFAASFNADANFGGATFSGWTNFFGATFSGMATFSRATFSEVANFDGATFSAIADFGGATFSGKTDFSNGVTFSGWTNFSEATFVGRTRFAGHLGSAEDDEANGPIFMGTEVDFIQVVINPPDAVSFVEADLTKCRFQDSDLRKVQFVGVTWPQKGQRIVIYDEIDPVESDDESPRPWPKIEHLYRELKQNYEDRRDYERAGDFHYGEKEMRRQNPDTARGLRFFLTLYWLFSGYGERYLRPLLWTGLLFAGSTIGYMWWGLRPKAGGSNLVWSNPWDWPQGAYYSFRVMTFLKPDNWVPVGYAHIINTFQTLLSPLFLGLFALALRQRLKR